jgi:hypothetical protein
MIGYYITTYKRIGWVESLQSQIKAVEPKGCEDKNDVLCIPGTKLHFDWLSIHLKEIMGKNIKDSEVFEATTKRLRNFKEILEKDKIC